MSLTVTKDKGGRRGSPNKVDPSYLLCPNVPKPLHTVNPRSIMGKEEWDKVRQEVYKSNNYHCSACGVHKFDAEYHRWLEAHEIYDIDYEKGVARLEEIVPLCHACHNYIHDGRMQMLVNAGQMSTTKWEAILSRGDLLIKGLKPKETSSGCIMQDWSKWCLIYKGKKYFSPFKNIQDWSNHFRR